MKSFREEVFCRDRSTGDPNTVPAVEHIEGNIDATINLNHAWILAATPAATRGIHRGTIPPFFFASPRIDRGIDRIRKLIIEDKPVWRGRVPEARNSIATDRSVYEMCTATLNHGGGIKDCFSTPRMPARLNNRVTKNAREREIAPTDSTSPLLYLFSQRSIQEGAHHAARREEGNETLEPVPQKE